MNIMNKNLNAESLSLLSHHEPFFEKGIHEYCLRCEDTISLCPHYSTIVIYRKMCKNCEFVPQALQFPPEEALHHIKLELNEWLWSGAQHGKSFLGTYMTVPREFEKQLNLIEDVAILMYMLTHSKCMADRLVAIVNFCKLRGNRIHMVSPLLQLFESCFAPADIPVSDGEIMDRLNFVPQSDEDDSPFDTLRSVLNCYPKMKELAIYKKLHKFWMYLLCTGMLKGTNIDFHSMGFDAFEEAALKRTHKPGFDMLHAMLDAVLFICEAGHSYFTTGSLDKFIHSGSSYEKWVQQVQKLKLQSRFLSNPEPHGFNRFEFVSNLKDAIEKGKAIIKFAVGMDKGEKLVLQKFLFELQLIEAEETTKRSAQSPRKDPFGILIHGSSHIAKSMLTNIMFYHFGKYFGLPIDDNYRYTRCPADEYWSGFDSTQWCIVLDDIAFLSPNGEVDPTLMELLQIKNSVPFTPPQAALEDKGRTPVKSELVIATTNTKDLNLHAYFACPFAIARRLSYVVTPTVKPEFAKCTFMADSKKIPRTPEGEYMNIWNFEISIPVPETEIARDNMRTKYEVIKRFDDIYDYLAWYISVAEEHRESQAKAATANATMKAVEVCKGCKRVTRDCMCASDEEVNPDTCTVCVVDPCVCTFVPQVDVEDFNKIFQMKLWLVKQIVDGQRLPIDDWWDWLFSQHEILEYLRTFFYDHIWYFVALLMVSCYLNPALTIVPLTTAYIMYNLIVNFWSLGQLYAQWQYGAMWKIRLIWQVCGNEMDTYKFLYRVAGERTERIRNKQNYLYGMIALVSAPIFLVLCRKVWEYCIPTKNDKPSEFVPQGTVGTVPVPEIGEKKTFYYHDPYRVTECDISGASKCAQGDNLTRLVRQSTAKFHFLFGEKGTWSSAVNVHGSIWLINAHALKADTGIIDVILDPTSQNVSRNMMSISFGPKDFVRIPDTDVALIELKAIAPGKSLLKYFPIDQPLKGRFKGKYILCTRTGEKSELQINNIRDGLCPYFQVPAYWGIADRATDAGDCGSMCIAEVGGAQVLMGTHVSANPNSTAIVFQHVSQKMLECVFKGFKPQVLEGSIPISAPGYTRNLVALHAKSPVRFLTQGSAKVYGSFSGWRGECRSKVKPTLMRDYAVKHGYEADFGKPCMNWKPWHLALKDMTTPIHSYQNENIKRCEDAFFNDIVTKLGDKISMLQVYTTEVALNGMDGVTYVDKINSKTSAGNPFKTTKKKFITEVEGKIVGVDPVIMDRVMEIERCYDVGVRFHPQFCGHLKDEPTPTRKIEAGKTRVFTGGEFAWSIIVRRYFLSHIRLIQNNPFIFEAMPGIVAQSTEWRDLYDHLTHFGNDRIVAGDYASFDKRMAAPFILAAFSILERLAERAGWPESDLIYLRCIAYDTAFPCIDFNGDLIEIQGNPSGHPLTVIINCLVNSLYMRYAYLLTSGKELHTFQEFVHLATYGDDNIMGVSPACGNFNHTRIAVAMKCIGVEYTMAEKGAASVPFIDIKDATFLKRSFVFDRDIGCVVAPLDKSSFHKMMTARLPKDDMADEAHAVCVIETAQREYFFHGREVFVERQLFFRQLVTDLSLGSWVQDSTFPDYYELVYEFWMRYDDVANAERFSQGYQPKKETTLNPSLGLINQQEVTMISNNLSGIDSRERINSCPPVQEQVAVVTPVRSPSQYFDLTEDEYESHFGNLADWVSQADVMVDETKHSIDTNKEGIISFMERSSTVDVGVGAASVLHSRTQDTDIHKFLARPVRTQAFTWNESDTVGAKINYGPWGDWIQTPSVKNKLNNYAFMKGDLKLKIQLSASPFYYGMLLMTYKPLTNFKNDTIYYDANNAWLTPISQRSHLLIDPDVTDTYEFTLPFIWPYNEINVQSLSDVSSLGNLRFDVITPLRSANGVSGQGVTVSLYAWMENIELSGASVGYAAQSDEYGEGCVSKPASWIANIAGRLGDIPVIGPFATATKIGAGAISAIASLFGFTNVPVIADAMPHRPMAFPQLASAEIGFPIEKLTLDPKNEMSVDPRIVGIPTGIDEMALSNIVMRDSYLTSLQWSTADAVDTLKFSCLVHPNLGQSGTLTGLGTYIQPTALYFPSQLFNYWRGDIIFTIRAVASKYHKGKIKISYDPNGNTASGYNLLTNTNTSNVVQTMIMDIGETREVELTIPYQQALQFLKANGYTNDWSTSTTPSFTTNRLSDNGTITLRVQNILTCPVASSTVDVQIWMRGGANFEYAEPTDVSLNERYSYFVPQSDEYQAHPVDGKVTLGNVAPNTQNQYLVHFGEDIKSFRQVLHRFSKLMSDYSTANPTGGTYEYLVKVVQRLPMSPGYCPSGYHTANKQVSGTAPYNFCEFVPLSLVANAYLCYRGSVNYLFNVGSTNPIKHAYVVRTSGGNSSFQSVSTAVSGNSQFARATLGFAGSQGASMTNQLTQAGLSVSCPFYAIEKFHPTDPIRGNVPYANDQDQLRLQVDLPFPTTVVNDNIIVTTYVAAGADFSLHYFLNAPTTWLYNTFPTAV